MVACDLHLESQERRYKQVGPNHVPEVGLVCEKMPIGCRQREALAPFPIAYEPNVRQLEKVRN